MIHLLCMLAALCGQFDDVKPHPSAKDYAAACAKAKGKHLDALRKELVLDEKSLSTDPELAKEEQFLKQYRADPVLPDLDLLHQTLSLGMVGRVDRKCKIVRVLDDDGVIVITQSPLLVEAPFRRSLYGLKGFKSDAFLGALAGKEAPQPPPKPSPPIVFALRGIDTAELVDGNVITLDSRMFVRGEEKNSGAGSMEIRYRVLQGLFNHTAHSRKSVSLLEKCYDR